MRVYVILYLLAYCFERVIYFVICKPHDAQSHAFEQIRVYLVIFQAVFCVILIDLDFDDRVLLIGVSCMID